MEVVVESDHFAMGESMPICSIYGIPSGEHTKSYGKSPFLIGKPSINGHFQLLC